MVVGDAIGSPEHTRCIGVRQINDDANLRRLGLGGTITLEESAHRPMDQVHREYAIRNMLLGIARARLRLHDGAAVDAAGKRWLARFEFAMDDERCH